MKDLNTSFLLDSDIPKRSSQCTTTSGPLTRWTHGDWDASLPTILSRTYTGFPVRFLGYHHWWFSMARSKHCSSSWFRIKYSWFWGSSWQPSCQGDFFPNHGNAHFQLPQLIHCQPQWPCLPWTSMSRKKKQNSDGTLGTTQYKLVHSVIYTQSLIRPLKSRKLSILSQIHNGVLSEVFQIFYSKQSLMVNKIESNSSMVQAHHLQDKIWWGSWPGTIQVDDMIWIDRCHNFGSRHVRL